MKTAAVLCTGPSLTRLFEPPPADLLIGVKRAAARFRCHWVAILDSPALAEIEPLLLGDPLLLTRRDYRPKYATRPGMDVEALGGPDGFDRWTATAALVLAVRLGADRIDVYGADWTDAPDFDGHLPNEANRSAERWARERQDWDQVVGWADDLGAKVRRLIP